MLQELSDHLQFEIPSHFATAPTVSINEYTAKGTSQKSCQVKTIQSFQPGNSSNAQVKDFTQLSTKQTAKRIHSKNSLKLLRNTYLKPQKINNSKKNTSRKQNIKRIQLKQKLRESEARRLNKKGQNYSFNNDMLEIRTIELNEQLKLLKTRDSHKQAKMKSMDDQELSGIILTDSLKINPNPKIWANQISPSQTSVFQNIRSCIEPEINSKLSNTTRRGRCFYDKLKEKLSQQMRKIKLKKQEEKPILLIQGCSMKSRPGQDMSLTFKTSLTQRPRPRTALARSGLQTSRDPLNIKRHRPMSSRAKILEKKLIQYMSKQIDQKLAKDMALCFGEKPQKKKKKKFSESSMSNLVHSNNLKHITPMHKKRNWSATKADINKEKIKEKMLELLIDCHDVGSKQSSIQKGIKIFENFCKKVDKNLTNTSIFIDQMQRGSDFLDDGQYL